jgi:hypothetical protein
LWEKIRYVGVWLFTIERDEFFLTVCCVLNQTISSA